MRAKILVVEDEAITAMDIKRTLELLDLVVVSTASRGEEAIQKAEEFKPDLVLMDIILKGDMDGIEAATEIQTYLDIPVIYLTAFSDKDTLQRAKLTKPYGFITKPVNRDGLDGTIETALYKHKLDKKLAASENKFRSLYSSMAEGVAIYDVLYDSDGNIVDYIITDINPAYEKILGLKRKEVIGQKSTVIYGLNKPPYLDLYLKAAEKGEPEHLEMYYEPMDKYFKITATFPEKDKFATFFEDITELKKAEEELKQAHALLEKQVKEHKQELDIIMDSIADGVIIFDMDGEIVLINRIASKFFEDIGIDSKSNLKERVEKYNWFFSDSTSITAENVPHIQALKGEVINNVDVYLKDSIGFKWFTASAIPLFNEKNKIFGAILTFNDITKRKMAEIALSESEEKFSTAFNASPAPTLITEKNSGRILEVNNAWLNTTGFQRDEVIGHTTTELELIPSQDKRKQIVEDAFKFRSDNLHELHVTGKDGKDIFLLANAITFKIHDIDCILSAGIDISERKKDEKQLKEMIHELERLNKLQKSRDV